MICPVCSKAMLTERPHVHPPTRPEPFDPRDHPHPLTVGFDPAKPGAERTVLVRRDAEGTIHVVSSRRPRRRFGCWLPFLLAALFWAAVLLAVAGWWR